MVGGAPGQARWPWAGAATPTKSLPVSGAATAASAGLTGGPELETWHWVQLAKWAWLGFEATRSLTAKPGP